MEKINQLKIGCNFDLDLIAQCARLNDIHGRKMLYN